MTIVIKTTTWEDGSLGLQIRTKGHSAGKKKKNCLLVKSNGNWRLVKKHKGRRD